jgi:uncharacterized small protein (DUF1192 family)
MTNHLSDRALLVQLNISQWTARKLDKKATREVADANYASRDAGNYHKKLLPMSDSLANIHTMTGSIRQEFLTNTLPWGLNNTHMLPTSNYLGFMTTFRKRKSEWEQVVSKFLYDYPSLQTTAQRFLGNLYNSEDYPDVRDLQHKFSMDLVVLPVPTSDFRVQLADDELSNIHADIKRRVEESSGMAMKEAWQRLYDRVKHMVERLSKLDDPKSRFHESTLEHVTELCRILPRLNFTDDPHLEAMRHEVEGKLAGLSKDAVVNDPVFRQTKIDEAADIMVRMGAFMGGV